MDRILNIYIGVINGALQDAVRLTLKLCTIVVAVKSRTKQIDISEYHFIRRLTSRMRILPLHMYPQATPLAIAAIIVPHNFRLYPLMWKGLK